MYHPPSSGLRWALNNSLGAASSAAASSPTGPVPAAVSPPTTYTSISCRDLRNSSAWGSTSVSDCSSCSACWGSVGCGLMLLEAAVVVLRRGNLNSVPGYEPCRYAAHAHHARMRASTCKVARLRGTYQVGHKQKQKARACIDLGLTLPGGCAQSMRPHLCARTNWLAKRGVQYVQTDLVLPPWCSQSACRE